MCRLPRACVRMPNSEQIHDASPCGVGAGLASAACDESRMRKRLSCDIVMVCVLAAETACVAATPFLSEFPKKTR